MAGEDTFECPDQETYDWMMGQFPEHCFPVLIELIDYSEDRENSVVEEFLPDENKFRCTTIDENGKEVHIEIGYTD